MGWGGGAGCLGGRTEDWMLLGAAGIKDGAALREGAGGLMRQDCKSGEVTLVGGRIGAGLHCLGGTKGRVWADCTSRERDGGGVSLRGLVLGELLPNRKSLGGDSEGEETG